MSTKPSPFTAAHLWIEALLSGTFAAVLMTLAIALLGYGLISGRIGIERIGLVVLGCFIFLSAGTIARSLLETAGSSKSVSVPLADPRPIQLPPLKAGPPRAYDPYAGASVPQ